LYVVGALKQGWTVRSQIIRQPVLYYPCENATGRGGDVLGSPLMYQMYDVRCKMYYRRHSSQNGREQQGEGWTVRSQIIRQPVLYYPCENATGRGQNSEGRT
jgi:hypothetical protein